MCPGRARRRGERVGDSDGQRVRDGHRVGHGNKHGERDVDRGALGTSEAREGARARGQAPAREVYCARRLAGAHPSSRAFLAAEAVAFVLTEGEG